LHVDTIAGLLKRFLRALPTPLITADVQQALSTCLGTTFADYTLVARRCHDADLEPPSLADLPNRLAVADAIYSCLQQLPKHRRLLLERLLHLLHKVSACLRLPAPARLPTCQPATDHRVNTARKDLGTQRT